MTNHLDTDRKLYLMAQDDSIDDIRQQTYLTDALFLEYTAFYIVNLNKDKIVAAHVSNTVKDIRHILHSTLSYRAAYTMYVQTRVALEDQRRMLEIGKIEHLRKELRDCRSFSRTFLRNYGGEEKYTEIIVRKIEEDPENGTPTVVFMAFRENDEEVRARMESASAEIETIHAALGSGSWRMEFNRASEIVSCHWSDTFRRMLGYTSKEDFPDEFRSVIRVWDSSERDAVMEHFWGMVHDTTGYATYDFSHRMTTKNRGVSWFRAVARIIRREDGSPMVLHGAFMDIDDEIQLRTQLERQKKELELALAQAQEANRAKTSFLANMSHDVRTPMNAIIGYTAIADAHLEDQEQVHDCLQKISRAGDHLLQLINEILDMSRMDSGKLQLAMHAGSLRHLLQNVSEIVQPLVNAQQQKLVLQVKRLEHDLVYLDEGKCERVLLNLIGNAIKFTPPQGQVTISLEELPTEKAENSCYKFRVQDTGIGMGSDFLPHLFEPFEREKTSTISQVQGSGLGLSIAENLVELMGGTISVDSIKGKGTTFTVHLPLERARIEDIPLLPAAAQESNAHSGEALPQADELFRGARILLVEDIDYNREIAQDILEEAGFVVESAENGHEAWEAVRQRGSTYFDLILMDIQMPVMDGYAATDAIRLLDGCSRDELPILALSANAFAEDQARSLAHGMNGHISKPIQLKHIIAELERALLRRKGKR